MLKAQRERPDLKTLYPPDGPIDLRCPVCYVYLFTIAEIKRHWEAGHFDTMKCECGFTWKPPSLHGHLEQPSLEPIPADSVPK